MIDENKIGKAKANKFKVICVPVTNDGKLEEEKDDQSQSQSPLHRVDLSHTCHRSAATPCWQQAQARQRITVEKRAFFPSLTVLLYIFFVYIFVFYLSNFTTIN